MVVATLNQTDNLYRLLVLLHVLTVIVGFGSTFVYPLLGNFASQHPGLEGKGISNATQFAGNRLTSPAIYAAGAFGLLLVVVGPFGFDESWVSAAMLLYIAAVLFSHFVHQPNLKKMDDLVNELAAGPPPQGGPPPQVVEMAKRGKNAARNEGILHLIFVIILILMIFGPRGAF